MMFAPPPTRPVHECITCKWSSVGYGAMLCVNGLMARKTEVNRDLRGICGPLGRLWQAKENPDDHP